EQLVLTVAGHDPVAEVGGAGDQSIEQLGGGAGRQRRGGGGGGRRGGRGRGVERAFAAGDEHDRSRDRREGGERAPGSIQIDTRMRSLANAPTPMWLPSISSVSVPSGEIAVTLPAVPGVRRDCSRNSSSPGVNSSSSGIRRT